MRTALIFLLCAAVSCTRGSGPPGAGRFEDDDPLLDRYRSENFLDLPRRAGRRLEAGTRYAAAPLAALPREDLHLAVGGERFLAAARRRREGESTWEAFHAAWRPARGLRLAGGDFVPDTGIGLVSSARRFSYRFLPGHPLVAGSIRPWTGFYDSFIRGGYAGAAAGPVGGFIFSGRHAAHAPKGTRTGEGVISGLRLSAASRRTAAGLLVIAADPAAGGGSAGFDVAAAWGAGLVALEVATNAQGRSSAAWGCRVRRGRYAAGMIAYDAPWRATGPFWHLPGASGRAAAARSGMAAYLRAPLPGRSSLVASFGRHGWRDGFKSGTSEALWVRYEVRCRAASVRLTWTSGEGGRTDEIPCPPAPQTVLSRSQALELAIAAPVASCLRLRCGLRCAESAVADGVLADASLSFQPSRPGVRLEAGGAWYRSTRGRYAFRYYEPAVPGAYPWRTVSGDGARWFVVCSVGSKRLRGFAGLSRQSGREAGGELGLNLKY